MRLGPQRMQVWRRRVALCLAMKSGEWVTNERRLLKKIDGVSPPRFTKIDGISETVQENSEKYMDGNRWEKDGTQREMDGTTRNSKVSKRMCRKWSGRKKLERTEFPTEFVWTKLFVHWSSRYSIQPYYSIPFDWKDANLLLWSLLYSIRLDGFFLQLQHRLEAAANHSTSLCRGALLRQSTVCRMSYLSWPPTHASLEA